MPSHHTPISKSELSSDRSKILLNNYYDAFAHFLKSGETEPLSRFIKSGSSQISQNYLQIYRNGFFKSCIDALTNNFSTTSKIIGSEHFLHLARSFVQHSPPNEGSLSAYGAGFPDFLAKHSHIYFAKDLARLDSAWLGCLYAPSINGLSASRVAELDQNGIDISNLKVALTPGSRFVELQYDVFDLWQNTKLDEQTTRTKNVAHKKSSIFFWQLEHQVIARSLHQEEKTFFQYIINGENLGDAATKLLEVYPDTDVSYIFSNLLTNNILIEE